jgi:hypothetical protein
MKQQSSKKLSSKKIGSGFSKSIKGFEAAGGITILELAALGAAAFVVWKNREAIKNFVAKNEIKIPRVLSEGLENILGSKDRDNDYETRQQKRH